MNYKFNKVKIFADGANLQEIIDKNNLPYVSGFTTNPTLMKKAGITDYETFSKEVLRFVKEKPVSLEVFSDDIEEMEIQARKISSWGKNVYVKIPVTNTKNISTSGIIKKMSLDGIKVNVTAIMTGEQIEKVFLAIDSAVPSYISIFAGRIADTGVDPLPLIASALDKCRKNPRAEVIWASPREVLNVLQADWVGCHIITITDEIMSKLKLVGYPLEDYSLDTVKMFYRDALQAGYKI
jgi:transaldolase